MASSPLNGTVGCSCSSASSFSACNKTSGSVRLTQSALPHTQREMGHTQGSAKDLGGQSIQLASQENATHTATTTLVTLASVKSSSGNLRWYSRTSFSRS